ncbi:unnamed protein product [Pedinophyceae sp. YPF-701]|nr:unnamed protein product [Pedinophyceae sp. YPF-701]
MWNDMNRAGVTSISPQEAKERVDSGEWVLVDIREPELYEKAHPTGAVSVPLFVKMTMENVSGVGDILKGAMLLSNGVTPVKGNPTFLEDLKKVAEAKGVILYCEAGGTLKPTTNFPYGKQSRSLVGTSKALDVGIENVAHLDGGIYGWFNAELPMDGEYDASMVGRTPNAALAATYPTKDEPY